MRLRLAVALFAAAAPAAAETQEPVVDRRWGYQVDIPEGWKAQPLEGAPPDVLLLYTHEPSDRMLVVSKVVGPSEDADLEILEAGIQSKAQRYKRLSAKKRALGAGRKTKVPAWDLWFRLERDGRPVTMGTRFLFYKSYALSILVDAPGVKTPGREARKIVESFVPPPK